MQSASMEANWIVRPIVWPETETPPTERRVLIAATTPQLRLRATTVTIPLLVVAPSPGGPARPAAIPARPQVAMAKRNRHPTPATFPRRVEVRAMGRRPTAAVATQVRSLTVHRALSTKTRTEHAVNIPAVR